MSMRLITIIFLLLPLYLSLQLQLPPLLKTTHSGSLLPVINVTIGQKFSLPLPHFDTPWKTQTFSAFQMSSQDLLSLQSEQPKKSGLSLQSGQVVGQGKRVPMDYLPFDCQLQQPKASIVQIIGAIKQQYSRAGSQWQENQYVHLNFKSLLYILNTGASQLTAYIYSHSQLQKIATHRLTQIQQHKNSTSPPPVMTASSKEDLVYVFSSEGLWQIQTNTVLASVKQIDQLSGFDSRAVGGVDKAIHGQGNIIIAMKTLDRVFVIPQPIAGVSQTYFTITQFNGSKIFPQDIILHGTTLLVLDFYKGVYLYDLVGDHATQKDYIEFSPQGGNYRFQLFWTSLFISFNDIDGSKIVQIGIDLQQGNSWLVRYIKSDQFISQFKAFTAITSYQGQSRTNRYQQTNFNSLLFIIQNYNNLQIYPFNLDPRTINQVYNAVKIRGNGIRHIFHLNTDRFLLVTSTEIQYIRIQIHRPSISCRTKRNQHSAQAYKFTILANQSSCQLLNSTLPAKQYFYQYCQSASTYWIRINDPESSQWRRIMIWLSVLGVVVCFVAGLVCLMQWRNGKMAVLGRLKDEIMRFRNRHRRMQPFAQQNLENRQIEVEMPQVVAVGQDE